MSGDHPNHGESSKERKTKGKVSASAKSNIFSTASEVSKFTRHISITG